jgi:hypothetical protein
LLAAPAENVRIILEGGSAQGNWRNVWREVFRGTVPGTFTTKEARETQAWMHEVRGMVGRGWEGWRVGVAKDIVGKCGYSRVRNCTSRLTGYIRVRCLLCFV